MSGFDPQSFELGVDTFKDRLVGSQPVLGHGRHCFAFHRRLGTSAAPRGRECIFERKESRHAPPETWSNAVVGRMQGRTRTPCARVAKVKAASGERICETIVLTRLLRESKEHEEREGA
jgi:hypothetical protein